MQFANEPQCPESGGHVAQAGKSKNVESGLGYEKVTECSLSSQEPLGKVKPRSLDPVFSSEEVWGTRRVLAGDCLG